MKIGLDIHGVADADPPFFSELTRMLIQHGHEVHIITGSEAAPELEAYLKKDLGLHWTRLFSITSYHKAAGTDITWVQGKPYMDEDLWNKTKARYCKENGIHIHLDDSGVYGQYFETPYARYTSGQRPESPQKIGVIGGSFNPITAAHLKMAEAVLELIPEIHQVWLMPAFRHPFEKHQDYADHRIRMIRMSETRRIRYFGYEMDHRLSGETYETFTRLLEDPEFSRYEFYMIIGSDCLLDFDNRWKHAGALSRLIPFIIIPRPGYDLSGYAGLLSRPPHRMLSHALTPGISATQVREMLRENKPITGLVPEPVERFILEKGLYKNSPIEAPPAHSG